MATTIVTKNSSTAAAVPTAGQLVQGELAVNVADKRLFTEDNGGTIVEVGTNPSTLTVTGEITANGGIALGDNDKATFGAGDDLQIYHDGSHSYVSDQGTGNIKILADDFILKNSADTETMIQAFTDASVSLWYDNAAKLVTTATGIDVTGSVSLTGSVVAGTGATAAATLNAYSKTVSTNLPSALRVIENTTASSYWDIGSTGGASNNLNFYANANTTPKMTLTGAGNVGIGISSPLELLHIQSATTSPAILVKVDGQGGSTTPTAELILGAGPISSNDSACKVISYRIGDYSVASLRTSGLKFQTTNANAPVDAMSLDNSGNLQLSGKVIAGAGENSNPSITSHVDTNTGLFFGGGDILGFSTGGAERMRIDSSGNLLVGMSSSNYAVAGSQLGTGGNNFMTRSGAQPLLLNRLSNDGDIALFMKDGTAVGSIGAAAGNLYIVSNDVGLNFAGGNDGIFPATANGAQRDAAIDLGASSHRFKDLYLSGGVYLGGTGAANHLDDYEEGTWTPVLESGTNITYTTQNGRYRKVGNITTCTAELVISNSDADGSVVAIGGFPFATSSFEETCVATLGRYTDFLGAKATAMSNVRFTGSAVLLMQGSNTGIQYNQVASSGTLQMSFTYISA